jgi:hypothetical protein
MALVNDMVHCGACAALELRLHPSSRKCGVGKDELVASHWCSVMDATIDRVSQSTRITCVIHCTREDGQ